MTALILVVATPYVARPGPDGRFVLDLPPGRYRLTAVSQRAAPASGEVIATAGTVDAPMLTLDESSWIDARHKNKFGQDYPAAAYKRYARSRLCDRSGLTRTVSWPRKPQRPRQRPRARPRSNEPITTESALHAPEWLERVVSRPGNNGGHRQDPRSEPTSRAANRRAPTSTIDAWSVRPPCCAPLLERRPWRLSASKRGGQNRTCSTAGRSRRRSPR